MENALIAHTLSRALAWDQSDFVDKVRSMRDALLVERLAMLASRSVALEVELDRAQELLSDREFDEFIHSPYVWNILMVQGSSTPVLLEQLLRTEARIYQFTRGKDTNVKFLEPGQSEQFTWDALGKCGLRVATDGTTDIYRNPRLGDGPILDALSPRVRGNLSEIPVGADDSIPEETLSAVSNKIQRALAIVSAIAPNAAELINRMTRVIAIRYDNSTERASTGFVNASTDLFHGMTVLENAHLDFISPERIADALVHEMTHSLFDIVEYYDKSLPNKHLVDRLQSPWTGKGLDPNTYIQACYVWFGLSSFWSRGRDGSRCDPDEAEKLLQQSIHGFSTDGYQAGCKYGYPHEIVDTLKWMQARIASPVIVG